MSVDAHRLQEFDDRGFTILPCVIDAAEVSALRRRLQICIEEDLAAWAGRDYPDAWMVHNLMVRGLLFARLLENEILHRYLAHVLLPTCILYAYTSSSMPPKGINYSCRIHTDCPRVIPGYVTNVGVMIALDDFTADNGATYFLPKSHNRSDNPSEEEFMEAAERVFPRRGDAVFFNGRTFHRGAANTTDEPRHAITMNVCRSYMRQRFDYPRLVPSSVVDTLGEVGRRFLGFDVRMPVSLEEYYLPEEHRLYKKGQG